MNNEAEYDSQAADYDKSRFDDDLGRHLDYMHKKILRDLIDSSSKRLLEAGVGTGRFATWLAKNGFDVVGIDLSGEMLEKAREKKARLNVEVDLIRADAHFLPFKESLFDGCICINVMGHIPDINGFLRQVRHALKSRGYFVFNFSNVQSLYLPIALTVNLRRQAMFRGGRIQSAWFTFKNIGDVLSGNGFGTIAVKGCFIATRVPFGNALIRLIQAINLSTVDSQLKFFAGSPFVKARADVAAARVRYL
jgi:ubiquinone/menaquinone biosynthesis C-methylase UbiE